MINAIICLILLGRGNMTENVNKKSNEMEFFDVDSLSGETNSSTTSSDSTSESSTSNWQEILKGLEQANTKTEPTAKKEKSINDTQKPHEHNILENSLPNDIDKYEIKPIKQTNKTLSVLLIILFILIFICGSLVALHFFDVINIPFLDSLLNF